LKGVGHVAITGDVADVDRQTCLTQFKEDPGTRVLLSTIGVGGESLNLTCASIVVFLDLGWSPAVNLQAQDRCCRIGQTRSVTIYEILAKGTVEEGIVRLLEGKLDDIRASMTVAKLFQEE